MLKEKYTKEIIPKLRKKLEIKNVMEVPKLEKVVLNM
jgi:large subunit ribosomal protein L5